MKDEDAASSGSTPAGLSAGNARQLKIRFTGVLTALVSTRKGDGRIHVRDLRNALYQRTGKDWDAMLGRYLRYRDVGGRPKLENAWALGEALHDQFNVHWISGFWMTYAAGRLFDFLGILAAYLYDLDTLPNYDNLVFLASLLACIESLANTTAFDRNPEIAKVHRDVLPFVESERVFDAVRKENKPAAYPIFDPYGLDEATRFRWREEAKIQWAGLSGIKAGIDCAYLVWLKGRGVHRGSRLIDGALAISSDSALSVFDKERLAFRVVEATIREHLKSDDAYEEYPFERSVEHPLLEHLRRFGIERT